MALVNQDIFYEVKKQILDKLDVILQKINLEIIKYIPQEEEFTFIELSKFQGEITNLFTYLDRLYASLNSSVSFSSIQSYKETAQINQQENERLINENERLRRIIQQINQNQQQKLSTLAVPTQGEYFERMRVQMNARLQPLRVEVRQLGTDVKMLGRTVKKLLKNNKFEMLQSRVQIISKLKDWEQEQYRLTEERENSRCQQVSIGSIHQEQMQHLRGDAEQILEAINQILSIC